MMDPKKETLSMWAARAQGDIVTKLTGNAEWGRLYSGYVSGAVSIAAFARAAKVSVGGAHSLMQVYRKPDFLLNAPGSVGARIANGSFSLPGAANSLNGISPGVRAALGGSYALAAPYGSYMKNGALITSKASRVNLLTAADKGGMSNAANAAKAAGAMRVLGVVGSAGPTLCGVANLSTYDSEKIAKNREHPRGQGPAVRGGAHHGVRLRARRPAVQPHPVQLLAGLGSSGP